MAEVTRNRPQFLRTRSVCRHRRLRSCRDIEVHFGSRRFVMQRLYDGCRELRGVHSRSSRGTPFGSITGPVSSSQPLKSTSEGREDSASFVPSTSSRRSLRSPLHMARHSAQMYTKLSGGGSSCSL